jgi:hypothetical protein
MRTTSGRKIMKKIMRYVGLMVLIGAAGFYLPCCDDNGTGPEPYDGPWKSVPRPEGLGPGALDGVFFLNPDLGYAVGCGASIIKYDGSSWKIEYSYPTPGTGFGDVCFNGPEDGWVVGVWGNGVEQKGLIVHYDGREWKAVDNIPGSTWWECVFFLDENNGWVGGYGIARWDGNEWRYETDIGFITDMYFKSPTDGWAINYYGPKIYHYDGVTWEKVFEQSMHHGYSIYFRNENRGCAAGGRTLLLEYVNRKWTEYTRTENLAYCEAVHFAPDGAGWAVGQRTYKWNEAQNKWLYVEAPFPRGTLYDVFVLNEGDAWAVGDAQILHYQP